MNTSPNVISLAMSEAKYDQERAEIRRTYGADKNAARQIGAARFEQEFALLFHRSGWTQERLAKKEGKSRQWIQQRLVFGRFLNFATNVANPGNLPNNLTEGRFRFYWEQTTKGDDERARFRDVIERIKGDTAIVGRRTPQLSDKLIKKFGDGKWYKRSEIAAAFPDIPIKRIEEHLDRSGSRGIAGASVDQKQIGRERAYRIFPKTKVVSLMELTEKLTPIIEVLLQQGRRNAATIAIPTVGSCGAQLRNLLAEWSERPE